MKIDLEIAFMSHLSDAQQLMELGCADAARQQINLVKMMYRKYHSSNREVDEEELDELWKEVQEKFGKKA